MHSVARRRLGWPLGVLAFLCVTQLIGCGSTSEVVFRNQTRTTIALAPSIILQPCTERSMNVDAARAAGHARMLRDLDDDRSWIPTDAVRFESGILARRTEGLVPFMWLSPAATTSRCFPGRSRKEHSIPAS